MKNRELAEKLLENPDSEVWCGAWNGHVDTYAQVDHVFNLEYGHIINDLYGTPGVIDKRLLQKEDGSRYEDSEKNNLHWFQISRPRD